MEIHHFHWGNDPWSFTTETPPLQDMLDRSRRAERSQSSQAPVPVRIKSQPWGSENAMGMGKLPQDLHF